MYKVTVKKCGVTLADVVDTLEDADRLIDNLIVELNRALEIDGVFFRKDYDIEVKLI